MKKILFVFLLLSTSAIAETDLKMNCHKIDTRFERCENNEVVCYVYDTGWAGMTKSGRGAGISCLPVIKEKEQKPFFIMVPKNEIK